MWKQVRPNKNIALYITEEQRDQLLDIMKYNKWVNTVGQPDYKLLANIMNGRYTHEYLMKVFNGAQPLTLPLIATLGAYFGLGWSFSYEELCKLAGVRPTMTFREKLQRDEIEFYD